MILGLPDLRSYIVAMGAGVSLLVLPLLWKWLPNAYYRFRWHIKPDMWIKTLQKYDITFHTYLALANEGVEDHDTMRNLGTEALQQLPTKEAIKLAQMGPLTKLYKDVESEANESFVAKPRYNPCKRMWSWCCALCAIAVMGITAYIYFMPRSPNVSIFVFGGVTTGDQVAVDRVEEFHIPIRSWSSVLPMPGGRRGGVAAAAHGDSIFIFGGWNGTHAFNRVDELHVHNRSWSTAPPMPGGWRMNFAAVAHGDSIFVFGAVNKVEQFHVPSRHWSEAPLMPSGNRTFLAAATHGDSIYVFGGCDGDCDTHRVARVDEFHVPSRNWKRLPSMLGGKRSGLAAATYGDSIFVFGGSADGHDLDRVEEFHIPSQQWKAWPSMPRSRNKCAAVAQGDSIYVFGGWYIDEVDEFHVPSRTWNHVTSMPGGWRFRAAVAAAAVHS